MNNLLCRAKRLDNGEWVEGLLCPPTYPGYVATSWHIAVEHDNEHGFEGKIWIYRKIDLATLCRCTGLKDKNGKLIFENEIMTRIVPIYQGGQKEPIGEYEAIGRVTMVEDGDEPPFYVIMARNHLGNTESMLLFVKAKGWHRPWYSIGNTIDNPELLEV